MPWAAGAFTRVYGSGGWVADRDAATPILATRHDTHDQDLATGINACLAKDGSNAATGNLNAGGFKITSLGTPTLSTDAATKAYVDAAGAIAFTAGDQILFRNAGGTAPTGWTIVAQNNKALRIVSGVASSGGANAFTTSFNSARTTSNESSHTHGPGTLTTGAGIGTPGVAASGGAVYSDQSHTHAVTGGATAAGSAHSHTLNLDVQYYDMNVIQKS